MSTEALDDQCSEREKHFFITLHTLRNCQYRKPVIRENGEQWR